MGRVGEEEEEGEIHSRQSTSRPGSCRIRINDCWKERRGKRWRSGKRWKSRKRGRRGENIEEEKEREQGERDGGGEREGAEERDGGKRGEDRDGGGRRERRGRMGKILRRGWRGSPTHVSSIKAQLYFSKRHHFITYDSWNNSAFVKRL